MQKGFQNMDTFSGNFYDDLDGVIESFETLSELCDLIQEQNNKAIPVMLRGKEFWLYYKSKHKAST